MPSFAELIQDVIASARESAVISDEERARLDGIQARRARIENLEPFRSVLAEGDFERIVDRRLDSRASRAVRWLLDEAQNNGKRLLWLCGGPGTGKTVAMMSAIAERGGELVMGGDLLTAFRDRENRDRGSAAVREKALRTRTLVIDDLGTSDLRADQEGIFQTLNKRQGGRMLTLITGNVRKPDVDALDGRITSRIERMGLVVELGDSDMRRTSNG